MEQNIPEEVGSIDVRIDDGEVVLSGTVSGPVAFRMAQAIAEGLMRRHDPKEACRTVFRVLEERMPGGVMEDVKRVLPEPIRDLWP